MKAYILWNVERQKASHLFILSTVKVASSAIEERLNHREMIVQCIWCSVAGHVANSTIGTRKFSDPLVWHQKIEISDRNIFCSSHYTLDIGTVGGKRLSGGRTRAEPWYVGFEMSDL
jgi:hypothetical protein